MYIHIDIYTYTLSLMRLFFAFHNLAFNYRLFREKKVQQHKKCVLDSCVVMPKCGGTS